MNRKVVVLGAGESGTGAALLAQAKGYEVFVSDYQTIAPNYRRQLVEHQIAFEEGGNTWQTIRGADEVIKSPGIPGDIPLLAAIREQKIPIIDEIEFASRHTNAFIIAITGSNGKTTTTHLTHHLLQAAGLDVAMAGNMGESFARKVALKDHAYYVLEVSSFQLEGVLSFKPHIVCFLNITPDHLDRYQNSIALYAAAKFRILQNMDKEDLCIYNLDDQLVADWIGQSQINSYPMSIQRGLTNGAWLADGALSFYTPKAFFQIPLTILPIVGKHNYYNVMAAVAVAHQVGVAIEPIVKSLQAFKGLPHRLEWLGATKGVDFYNDSKATNLDSVVVALESFERPIVWIAGGYDKGNDYSTIVNLVTKKVKYLICLGKDNEALYNAFSHLVSMKETKSVVTAVKLAFEVAQQGDVVLLSPACASFDLFKNFEDRGNQFKAAVNNLIHQGLA